MGRAGRRRYSLKARSSWRGCARRGVVVVDIQLLVDAASQAAAFNSYPLVPRVLDDGLLDHLPCGKDP